MKLTKEQKQKVKEYWGNWSVTHALQDIFVMNRLEQLDPEFVQDVNELFKTATFYYYG